MLNPDLDFEPSRAALAGHSRVQIHDVLDPASAGRLHECLRDEVPWTLAYRENETDKVMAHAEYAAMEDQQRQSLYARLAHASLDRYGFVYDSYMMVTAYKENRDPGLLLNPLLEFLNSSVFLGFARQLTGEPRIRRVSAQATRYLPGQFLRQHNDSVKDSQRLFAYVINLGRDWRPDWGGLLQFADEQGAISASWIPHYNSLSLFRVPQRHWVTLVAPWARRPRLAITGWFEA